MTLDEAIEHCLEAAARMETKINDPKTHAWDSQNFMDSAERESCGKCAEEHRQLAEWLNDYKRLLENNSPYERYLKKSAVVISQLRADRDRLLESLENLVASVRKLQTYKLFEGGEKLVELDDVLSILEGEKNVWVSIQSQ